MNLTKMSHPPASLPMNAFTSSLRLNFERAFSKEGEKLGFRPSPQDWITSLLELSSKLKQCSTHQSHYFLQEVKSCPWCDIETKCNASFFPIIGPKSSTDINISGLWQQFLSIKSPISIPPLPDIANFQTIPSNNALQIGKKLKSYRARFAVLFFIIVAAFSGILSSAFPIIALIGPFTFIFFLRLYNQRKKKLTSLISETLNSITPTWESLCLQHETLAKNYSFEFLRNQINDLKSKHDDIGREREKRFQVLRVLNRCALIAAAGTLATELGISGWTEEDAMWASKEYFQSWLKNRGGISAQEGHEILRQIRHFFEQHGDSRFSTIGENDEQSLCFSQKVLWRFC